MVPSASADGPASDDVIAFRRPHGLKPAGGDNALGDGQLFYDFRNPETIQFWVDAVILGAVENKPYVDGVFSDDPAGYGQEHPAIQSAVQLTPSDVAELQAGTQQAWTQALEKMVPMGKYFYQAFRSAPPGPSATSNAACSSWMRTQCAVPSNTTAIFYNGVSSTDMHAANFSIASFLVVRGAYSYITADQATIERQDEHNPFYRIFQLDVGTPVGGCVESPTASRKRDTFLPRICSRTLMDAVACDLLFMLTCAISMTSSHSEGRILEKVVSRRGGR